MVDHHKTWLVFGITLAVVVIGFFFLYTYQPTKQALFGKAIGSGNSAELFISPTQVFAGESTEYTFTISSSFYDALSNLAPYDRAPGLLTIDITTVDDENNHDDVGRFQVLFDDIVASGDQHVLGTHDLTLENNIDYIYFNIIADFVTGQETQQSIYYELTFMIQAFALPETVEGTLPDEDEGLPDHLVDPGLDNPGGLVGDLPDVLSKSLDDLEYGVVHLTQSGSEFWQFVQLQKDFDDPIVIAGPMSYNDASPGHVRVRQTHGNNHATTPNSFEIRIEEWDYQGDNTHEFYEDDGRSHEEETIYYIVAEKGVFDYEGIIIEARKVSNVNHEFKTKTFDAEFSSTPIVIATVQTYNGPDPIVPVLNDISASGFSVKVQEEEASGGLHNNKEKIGYIAIEEVSTSFLEAAGSLNTIDAAWRTAVLISDGSEPLFVSSPQKWLSDQEAASLRYTNDGGIGMLLQEEKSLDSEIVVGATASAYITLKAEVCDGLDNDADGIVDNGADICAPGTSCIDAQCRESACDDGVDNDYEGAVDCSDDDCVGTAACPILSVAAPEYGCGDINDDGFITIEDTDIIFNAFNGLSYAIGLDTEQTTRADVYPDGAPDGVVDSIDQAWIALYLNGDPSVPTLTCAASTVAEICTNALDDDSDGTIDCLDADCNTACLVGASLCGDLNDDGYLNEIDLGLMVMEAGDLTVQTLDAEQTRRADVAALAADVDGIVTDVDWAYFGEYLQNPSLPLECATLTNIPGDVNTDETVTIDDAIALAQFVLGIPVTIDETVADADCSGTITIDDAIHLARNVLGIPGFDVVACS